MTYEYLPYTMSLYCSACGYVDTVEGKSVDVLDQAKYAGSRHLVDAECGGRVTIA